MDFPNNDGRIILNFSVNAVIDTIAWNGLVSSYPVLGITLTFPIIFNELPNQRH